MMRSVRAYRDSATEGANHIDILLACYDALAEDIRLAGKSAVTGDVAARCRHSEHALILLGHLESWVTALDDADLAGSLTKFYEYLRAQILRLQLSRELDDFMNLALVVCETRAAWQQKHSAEQLQSEGSAEPLCSIAKPDGATSHFVGSA
jgi:flagellin-specific chaperone FliS